MKRNFQRLDIWPLQQPRTLKKRLKDEKHGGCGGAPKFRLAAFGTRKGEGGVTDEQAHRSSDMTGEGLSISFKFNHFDSLCLRAAANSCTFL